MASAILGQPYTFQTRFLNADNEPIAATGVTVKVFRFGPSGDEIVLATSSMSAVPGDSGRFQYTYAVPSGLAAGGTLYAVMYGTNPSTLDAVVDEVAVQLVAPSQPGLTARFLP